MAILDLPEGEHQYKFLVDGQWTHDPAEVKFALSHSLLIEPSEEEKGAVQAGEREVSAGLGGSISLSSEGRRCNEGQDPLAIGL